jgi:squalene monooxygenase
MQGLDVDVLIAGGSVAGIAAAAALQEFGWSVLIVEPGQRTDRRLAGELIHPMGVAGLKELGLFDADAFADGVSIRGFAIVPDADHAQSSIVLPYGAKEGVAPTAMAVDYSTLRRNLDKAARALPNVTFLDNARVGALDLADPARPRVTVEQRGSAMTITCRLVIAADGAASPVRTMAGIGSTRRSISTITGYVIDAASLPVPGFGHVIMGGKSLVLAYEVGGGRARVMFDQPVEFDDVAPAMHRDQVLGSVPAPLRGQIAAAIQNQKPLSFRSAEVVAHRSWRGSVVLVGDAGGSCHPLTATGMSVGISDGLRLRDALRRHPDKFSAAFRHYDRARRRTQRSRRMVASALHDVCSRCDPELRVVRAGLLRYLRDDERSAAATMAILSMTDLRISSAFWQFLKVTRHGLADYWQNGDNRRVGFTARLVAALGAMTIQRMGASLRAR